MIMTYLRMVVNKVGMRNSRTLETTRNVIDIIQGNGIPNYQCSGDDRGLRRKGPGPLSPQDTPKTLGQEEQEAKPPATGFTNQGKRKENEGVRKDTEKLRYSGNGVVDRFQPQVRRFTRQNLLYARPWCRLTGVPL